jgi:hypothetical protein
MTMSRRGRALEGIERKADETTGTSGTTGMTENTIIVIVRPS